MIEICDAIKRYSGKGYRRNRNGRYETFISEHGKSISLGTYDTEEEAYNVVVQYKLNRLEDNIRSIGVDVSAGKITHDKYLVFPNGVITNLCGVPIKGFIDRCGYSEIILLGKMERRHRVVAEAFLQKVVGKDNVNHKNGIKTDNRVENLEWCTKSENTTHAYKLGLEKKMTGTMHHRHMFDKQAINDIRTNCEPETRGSNGIAAFAKKYGCDYSTIARLVKGVSYADD